MSTRTPSRSRSGQRRQAAKAARAAEARRRQLRRLMIWVAAIAVVAGGGLFLLLRSGGGGDSSNPTFAVGRPGPGVAAPPIQLDSTSGGSFDLAAERGKTVLLYFQEGIGCQPCWKQIQDIEKNWKQYQSLGINEFVSIAGNPMNNLRQKASDEGIATPVLADPDLSLGKTYSANQYGMMGSSAYGHSFIVVGPDGNIEWRADYGGAPNYTMYVQSSALLKDLRKGLRGVAPPTT
jgi:peroxiredoxin